MFKRIRLFRTAILRSTISQPVLAISIRDRDAREGCPFDMPALVASIFAPQPA